MKIILLGVPGSGKGTQGKLISKEYNIPQICMGDILRHIAEGGDEESHKIKEILAKGDLVPDNLTLGLIEKRIKQKDCENGYILDGFPRDLNQAKELKKITEIDNVLFIHLSEKEVIERITKRRICSSCGKIYHLTYNPPKNGKCECGRDLEQREDDNEISVKERLKVYHEMTEPVIEFYRKEGKLSYIEGENKIKEIFREIKKVLN